MTVVIGDLRDPESLGAKYITTCGKATTGGSKVVVGRLVKITEASGLGALATAGDAGPFGVVPNLYPVNADSDATMTIVRGNGCEVYVEANGAIKPHQRVVADTGGKVKAAAAEADTLIVGEYMGKEGEGRAHGKPITDAAATNVVCIRLTGGGMN
jgi:hypothetical protein